MIAYHPAMKNTHNFKIVVFEILKNSKIISKTSNFKSHLLDVNGP
jgi:hypothetical protein